MCGLRGCQLSTFINEQSDLCVDQLYSPHNAISNDHSVTGSSVAHF